MNGWDKEYLKLCKKILSEGKEVENRTGINTIKYPEAYNFSFDLEKEFPILTTKQLFVRQAILEMLWIWQVQSNKVDWLKERNVHIWDEWEVDNDGIYRIYDPYEKNNEEKEVDVMDPLSLPIDDPNGLRNKIKPKLDDNGNIMKAKALEGKINAIKAAKYYGKEYAGTIGTAYGFITDRYKHTQNLIDMIKSNPNDRRMVKSLWQDEFLRTAVLPSCVWSTEWNITGDTLNLSVHQRSCDVPLGLPFNVTQYATFLSMIAQVTGLKPGKINYTIAEPHIYVNQIEGIKKQIAREKLFNKLSKYPKEELNKLYNSYANELSKITDKKSDEYLNIDSKMRIIDMIINPSKAELWLNPEVKDFFEFDNSSELKDVKVLKYKHMGKINFPLAQ